MRRIASLAVVGLVAALGFGRPGGVSAQSALPRIVPVFTSTTIDGSPQALFSRIEVGPQGHMLFNAEGGAAFHLVLLDSAGKVLKRLAREGEGPGEARNPIPVYVGQEEAVAWDVGLLRLSEWSFDGTLRRSSTPKSTGAFVARVGNQYLGFVISSTGAKPVTLDPATGGIQDLLPPADSFYHAEFKPASPSNPVSAAPTFGEWTDGFIVANPATYHIGLYRKDGTLVRVLSRTIPPSYPGAARLDRGMAQFRTMKIGGRLRTEAEMQVIRSRAAATPVPSFAIGVPLRTDAKRRIWVVGIQGDSAFADVFAAGRFLGRIGISCPGFEGKWSLSGSWLAMVCAPQDPNYDGNAVVRLFRITGN